MELHIEALEQLVAASRAGQPVLQRLPEVASCMRRLLAQLERGSDDPEDEEQRAAQHRLLLCYRVARNAAATGGEPACAALLGVGLLELVRATLDLVSAAAIALNWQLPAAVAQALANLCTACARSAAAAWAALFPLHLNMLAHVNAGATQAATCLALLSCCTSVPGAAAALAGPPGSQMMTALLCNHRRQLQQGEHNDNLCLLVAHLAFRQDLLPELYCGLGQEGDGDAAAGSGPGSGGGAAAPQPTMAQAALLEALSQEAHEMPAAPGAAEGAAGGGPGAAAAAAAAAGSPGRQRRGGSMRFLLGLVQQLAAAAKQAGGLTPGQQQVLQDGLHLARDLCARDDGGRGLAGGADLVAELQAAGAVPALLAMLKALEPIQSPQQARQAQQQGAGGGGGAAHGGPSAAAGGAGGIHLGELAPQLAEQAAQYPATPSYHGFRSDLLAALANAAHGRPAVQREVQGLGGVELVLAQCQLDRQSPLAREWALWGVRNLCEGNPEAQEAIRQLQLCTTVESEELQRLGLKLELDEQTGKMRVTQRQPPPGAAEAAEAAEQLSCAGS